MNNDRLIRTGWFLFIISIVITIFILAKSILVPFLLSVFITYLLYPLVWKIERRGVHRGVSILLVLLVATIVIGGVVLLLSIKLSNATLDFESIKETLDTKTDAVQNMLEKKAGVNANTMNYYVEKASKNLLEGTQSALKNLFSATSTVIFQIGLMPVFIFFLLFYRTKTAYFIFRLVGRKNKALALHILREISSVTTKYLGGMLIVVVILAVLTSIGLLIIGVKHAVIFGSLAAILNLIPYIGTFIGGLIPFMYILFTSSDPTNLLIKIVVVFLIVQFLENNLITPNIVGNTIKINPLAIILGMLFANMIWGVAGMLIVMPMLAILKVIMRNVNGFEPYAYLMSNRGTEKHNININLLDKIKKKIR
ncbi:MAG: AI-2E family transporter [Bacteroidales bacterium]|nr:AI-2E family transporter [Bacteroidales bacterium]